MKHIEFKIGSICFCLKQEYQYTDRNTGKAHYQYLFKITSQKESYENILLKFYTGWFHPEFVYSTCSYYDNRHHLQCSIGLGKLYLYFPWRNKKVLYEEDVNNPEKRYGFYFYGEGGIADSFWYYRNGNGYWDAFCIPLPWSYTLVRHSMLLKTGWYDMYEKDRIRHIKNGTYDEYRKAFEIWDDDKRLLKKSFPFRYMTKSGEVQETTATCYMEEREWRPMCMKRIGLFKKKRTQLWICFKNDMGEDRNSWKGGTYGVGCNVTNEEKAKMDFESPLRRYEKEVNKNKSL